MIFAKNTMNGKDDSTLTELRAGVTTFLTMAYILFVQPAVLSAAGMPAESVFLSTCVVSALATLLMGLLANYPVALAPGMGNNFFFVFSISLATLGGATVGWRAALAVVFLSGVLFFLLSVSGLRELVLKAVPPFLRHAIGAGIGMFITLIGLEHAGIVVDNPGTLIDLGNLHSAPAATAIAGLVITAVLVVRQVRGAILWGILSTALIGWLVGGVHWKGIAGMPAFDFTVFFALDFSKVFTSWEFLALIFVALLMDVFDTMGTLVAVGEHIDLPELRDEQTVSSRSGGRLKRAFLADSIATVGGSLLGNSTVTSYIESGAGVQDGARTGRANLSTAACFLLAIFFAPLASTVGGGWLVEGSNPPAFLYPVTAPALIIVGSMMLSGLSAVDWKNPLESIPALFASIGMTFAFSIADGIGLGFISYVVVMTAAGNWRKIHPVMWVVSLAFLVRFGLL